MSTSVHAPLHRPSSLTAWFYWRRWIAATALGELIGFAAPALAGVLVARSMTASDQPIALLLAPLLLVLAGGFEGAALGLAQWLVLRRVWPVMPWWQWTMATALAAMVAWLLGMLPNTLADVLGWNMRMLIIAWLVVAPGIILSISTAQWLVLRRYAPHVALWIPLTALGWLLGVLATFAGASLINETMPIGVAVIIGVASGVLMGIVAGAISGLGLVQIVRRRGNQVF